MQTGTDYGPFLANEPSPMHTTTLVDCCTRKLVADWRYMRENVSRGSRPALSDICVSRAELGKADWPASNLPPAPAAMTGAEQLAAAMGSCGQDQQRRRFINRRLDPPACSHLFTTSSACLAGGGAAGSLPGLLHLWPHD